MWYKVVKVPLNYKVDGTFALRASGHNAWAVSEWVSDLWSVIRILAHSRQRELLKPFQSINQSIYLCFTRDEVTLYIWSRGSCIKRKTFFFKFKWSFLKCRFCYDAFGNTYSQLAWLCCGKMNNPTLSLLISSCGLSFSSHPKILDIYWLIV